MEIYCLNCLYSMGTKEKCNQGETFCKNNKYCKVTMHIEDNIY